MTSQTRHEYHWIEGRVVERRISRPSGCKRWTFDLTEDSLVAVIEPRDASFEVRRGPAATDDRVIDAVRIYEGVFADTTITDLGSKVPKDLARRAAEATDRLLHDYVRQYKTFGQEEDISAAVKSHIHDTTFKEDGWRIAIKSWTYSRQRKEDELGLDIGILVDILADGQRIVKALWLQAKRSETLPDDILDLKDLVEQLEDMLAHTSESYAIVFTSQGAHIFHADSPRRPLSPESVIFDAILCERGDRDPIVVALTADGKLLLHILISG